MLKGFAAAAKDGTRRTIPKVIEDLHRLYVAQRGLKILSDDPERPCKDFGRWLSNSYLRRRRKPCRCTRWMGSTSFEASSTWGRGNRSRIECATLGKSLKIYRGLRGQSEANGGDMPAGLPERHNRGAILCNKPATIAPQPQSQRRSPIIESP